MRIFGKFSKSMGFYFFVLIIGILALITLVCFIEGRIMTGFLHIFTICIWIWAERIFNKSLKRMKNEADSFIKTSEDTVNLLKLEYKTNVALIKLIREDGSIDMQLKAAELLEWRPEALSPDKEEDET